MTEAEWSTCAAPKPMLEFLQGQVSPRKLQLFQCACVRGVWQLLRGDISRLAVEVAEQVAEREGRFSFTDANSTPMANVVYAIHENAVAFAKGIPQGEIWKGWSNSDRSAYYAAIAAAETLHGGANPQEAVPQAVWVATAAAWAMDYSADAAHDPATGMPVPVAAGNAERARQAAMLRDLFGPLPFRKITVKRAWRSPTVVRIAKAIHEKRALRRLSRLAQALEEVGCKTKAILQHCRQPGEHVRGCWVVDLILGKE